MILTEIRFKQTNFTETSRTPQHKAVEPAGPCFLSPTCVSHGILHQLCHIWFTSSCSSYPLQDSSDGIKVSSMTALSQQPPVKCQAQSVWKDFKVWNAGLRVLSFPSNSLRALQAPKGQKAKGFSQPWADHECTGNKFPRITLLENSSTSVFHCLFCSCCLPANALLNMGRQVETHAEELQKANCQRWTDAQNQYATPLNIKSSVIHLPGDACESKKGSVIWGVFKHSIPNNNP